MKELKVFKSPTLPTNIVNRASYIIYAPTKKGRIASNMNSSSITKI